MEPILAETISPAFSWPSLAFVVALIVAGMLLLALEVFALPGFGAAGVVAFLLLGGGCVSAWVFLGPAWGALVVVASIVASVLLVVVGLHGRAMRRRT
ncbi:MAG: hypothetical protein PHU25_21180 [Deltaproteobacteria bacterium]|nr:hypothetical protein [Deltaproteobacteria bacterium]